MIVEYHRPDTLQQAVELLRRPDQPAYPLAGGTWLNRASAQAYAVVDLQNLGLNYITRRANRLEIGATTTLQALIDQPNDCLPAALVEAACLETTHNLRQVASLAGTLVTAGGRSPLVTALLALDAMLTFNPGEKSLGLGDWLPLRPSRELSELITHLTIPCNARLAYAAVARTPADQPIVCAALARWSSGRTRLALGGFGSAPSLAFDGPEPGGIAIAARNAYALAGDAWASADYRSAMAEILAQRCLDELNSSVDAQ
jgi:probable selenate reductase FAD-binding subunit